MVAEITTPYRERHPNVRFTILSRTSIEILALLENLEIDAGITYLDNEPLGRVTAVPFYEEHYRLITSSEGTLGDRESVTWAEVGSVPLCLLTPDMQNRRIIDGLLAGGGRARACRRWNRTPSSCSSRMCAPAAGRASCRRSSRARSG